MLFLSDFTTRVIDGLCLECIHSLCRKVWISLQLKPTQTSQVETESRYGLRKSGHCHALRVTDHYLQLDPELVENIPGSKCKNNKCCVQPFLFSYKRKYLLTFRDKLYLRFDSVSWGEGQWEPSGDWVHVWTSRSCKWMTHELYWICKSFLLLLAQFFFFLCEAEFISCTPSKIVFSNTINTKTDMAIY